MNMLHILLIGLGGFLGSVARFIINKSLQSYLFLPMGTLIVNIIGSFLVGLIAFNVKDISHEVRLFSIIGFTGALTTMSTFAFETFLMLESCDISKASLNICANIIFSITAIFLGKTVAKLF